MIEILKNDSFLGGVSYCVSAPDELAELPPEYRELISDREIAALTDHSAFFSELRDKCRFAPMKSWLSLIAASEGVSVTAYIDDMRQRAALINTLGGSICLTPSSIPDYAPNRLRDVFEIIGSIHQHGFRQPYVLEIGIHGTIEKYDARTLEYSSGPAPGSYVTEFYSADCGDRLLAVGDQVYHYHIGGSICAGAVLDDALTEYFTWLSGGESSFEVHVPYEKVKSRPT